MDFSAKAEGRPQYNTNSNTYNNCNRDKDFAKKQKLTKKRKGINIYMKCFHMKPIEFIFGFVTLAHSSSLNEGNDLS